MKIHKTAIINPKASIDTSVEIGPNTIIGPDVKIGKNTNIFANCVIDGDTTIGENCKIFTGTIIGSIPQDLKYKGERTKVVIGNNNTIREYTTINLGTEDNGATVVGSNNLLMAYVHIAHDCKVGSDVVIANCGTLAGHVTIDDRVIIGGLTAVHQFVRVGKLAIIGGCSKVVQDIPPYVMADGHPAKVFGLNSLGLKRAGIAKDARENIKKALHMIYSSGIATRASIAQLDVFAQEQAEVQYFKKFVTKSKRGLCKSAWATKTQQDEESA